MEDVRTRFIDKILKTLNLENRLILADSGSRISQWQTGICIKLLLPPLQLFGVVYFIFTCLMLFNQLLICIHHYITLFRG